MKFEATKYSDENGKLFWRLCRKEYNKENGTSIILRQVKYLNNMVEQDHRGIKRITNYMLGFKEFYSASVTLSGIELVRMLKKGQMETTENTKKNTVELFYSLVL